MTFSTDDIYKHSVLSVCQSLAEGMSGSADPLKETTFDEYVAWLEWRLHEGWQPSLLPEFSEYNQAVRELGLSVLRLIKGTKP